jgi:hypothetical protein
MPVQKVYLLNQNTPVIIPSGLVPKGAYNAGTDYAVGDSVDYNGSSYVMYVDAAAGTLPTDTTKWQVLANKGATGATGSAGSNGTNGTNGTDGVDGVDGASITSATFVSDDIVFTKDDATTVTLTDAAITLKGDPGTDGTDGTDGLTVSVNSVTQVAGNITLDQDDIPDGTTNKAYTATEQSKLAGIEALADVTDATNVASAGAVMDGDFSANGLMTRTAAGTYAARTITGTTNQITVTNGDGVSGNPTLSTPQDIHTGASPTFAGGTETGTVEFRNAAAVDNPRLVLKSDQEWVSPTHKGDLIRLQPTNDYYKAAMAWTDKSGVDKLAFVGHDYLASYSAALDKTFTTANITNGSPDTITLTSHGWSTGDTVWFSVSSNKVADMLDGIFPYYRYYIRSITSDTVAVYRSSADATANTNPLPLDNGNAAVTYTITKNNQHHHVSIEAADGSATLGLAGELHTRLSMNYDVYPSVFRYVDVELQQIDQPLKLIGTGNKELHFATAPDRSGRRWSLQHHASSDELRIVTYTSTGLAAAAAMQLQLSNGYVGIGGAPSTGTDMLKVYGDIQSTGTSISLVSSGTAGVSVDRAATTNFASFIFRTATSDKWTIGLRNDSTNDFHFRDNTNGVTALKITTNANPVLTITGTLTMTDAKNIAVGTTTGTKIGTATTQKLGFFNATPVVQPSAYTTSNVTTDRTFDANSTTLDEVADVLGTLIADLKSLGLVG